jgi:hypothetical protein
MRTARIPTVTRSIPRRLYRHMCRSWLPAIAIYAVFFAVVAIAEWGNAP